MLDLGLKATVNSDDPSYFGGYMTENFWQVAKALGLTQAEAVILVRNSIDASFIDQSYKDDLHKKMDVFIREYDMAPQNKTPHPTV
jgi:adenosine deaminase